MVLGIVLALVISETGLRLAYYLRPPLTSNIGHLFAGDGENDAYESEDEYPHKNDSLALMRYDTLLGYSPLENHQGNGYSTNSHGFRYTEDFDLEKPSNEFRVFITGGSTAWGAGPSQDDVFSHRIEQALQQYFPLRKIRVITAGVGAYVSTHERILILNVISELQPDLIVMFSGWNDTYAGYRGMRALSGKRDFLNAGPILARWSRQFCMPHETQDQVLKPPRYHDYDFKTQFLVDRFLYSRASRSEIEASIAEVQLDRQVVVQDLIKNVLTVRDLSKRQHFTLLFCLQPTLYNTNKQLSEYESRTLHKNRERFVGFPEYNAEAYDLYRKQLPLIAEQEEFCFVDSDEAIDDEPKTVFDDHVHLGDRGNRLVSEYLTRVMKQHFDTMEQKDNAVRMLGRIK